MNGSRYDQIRSSGVRKTYIPYCTDWKMAFVWLLYQPSTHKFQIYCGIIPVIIPMKFLKMPQNNKFLSKLILCGILKNVKSISGANYIDSLHMKWCTLKNMGNWPFSPGHTMSHKNNNILRTAPDFTKIKIKVCRKHTELSVIAISSVLVENGHLCYYFPPTAKFYYFSHYAACDFAHRFANIPDIPTIFVSCTVFGVVNNIQALFDGSTGLSYLPMDQPLNIVVKNSWQKTHQSCSCWYVKKWYSCIFGTQPRDFYDP